ncbi:tricorn protease-like protein [Nocardia tenerifensis]|uniref:Tricorn protease-like protein n=1 Tax=Nocardia tenerifensis TaxID=228006 RepID=A0A318K9M0_9NOCA|nr:S41 family peptidase [Nocardia tenerifensis]PXX66706.1 tricorn protease-like protein [Nocardia tenerifensis]
MILQRDRTAVIAAALIAVGTITAACRNASGPAELSSGFWEVVDYGSVLSVRSDSVETYQLTDLSCLKEGTATRSGSSYLTDDKDVLTLRPGDGPDQAELHIDGSPGDRTLRRLTALPEKCTSSSRPASFDVFWQTFQENYPFFAAKGIDWQQVRDRFRDRAISAEQRGDDASLFATLRDMVSPLNDAHVVISAGDSGFFGQGRPGTVVPSPQFDQRVKEHVQQRDLHHPLADYANGRISYADLPDQNYGYLRVSSFSGYTPVRTFAADSAELDRALDAIFTPDRLTRLRGLILDLRLNGGGSDSLGLQLAARLTDRPHFAYAKKTRTTHPQPQRVTPAPAAFAGPIALLTSGSTISAGETFTQAMLERPCHNKNRPTHPGRLLRRHAAQPPHPPHLVVHPPQRRIPHLRQPNLRRTRHPTPPPRARLHGRRIRPAARLRLRPRAPLAHHRLLTPSTLADRLVTPPLPHSQPIHFSPTAPTR